MLDLNDIAGAADDLDEDPQMIEPDYPDMVPGRVAHIDADFLAYMASYERDGENISVEDIIHKSNVMIHDKRREAGAEFAVLHLTPSDSNKGGRYDAAIQKRYQANRDGQEKPRHLSLVREYMAGLTGDVRGRSWENAEADDGMAEAGWKNHAAGSHDLCVIVTKDKDLRMVPGWHMDWDTGVLTKADDTFGWIGIKERATIDKKTGKERIVKKHDGFGTKFFWFQLLMGDTADNIKGCPKAVIGGKHKLCGLVGAYELLRDAADDRECLSICMDAFKTNEYVHWENGEAVPWVDVFWSEAKMLWMQRTPGDIDDVKKWIKYEVLK